MTNGENNRFGNKYPNREEVIEGIWNLVGCLGTQDDAYGSKAKLLDKFCEMMSDWEQKKTKLGKKGKEYIRKIDLLAANIFGFYLTLLKQYEKGDVTIDEVHEALSNKYNYDLKDSFLEIANRDEASYRDVWWTKDGTGTRRVAAKVVSHYLTMHNIKRGENAVLRAWQFYEKEKQIKLEIEQQYGNGHYILTDELEKVSKEVAQKYSDANQIVSAVEGNKRGQFIKDLIPIHLDLLLNGIRNYMSDEYFLDMFSHWLFNTFEEDWEFRKKFFYEMCLGGYKLIPPIPPRRNPSEGEEYLSKFEMDIFKNELNYFGEF